MEHKTKSRKVFICSPYRPRGNTKSERAKELENNREMAMEACDYAVSCGYMPLAPHLYFTAFLSDEDETERETGIHLGLEWLYESDEIWVIGSRITEGMKREIRTAIRNEIPVRCFLPCRLSFEQFLKDIFSEH